MGVKPNRRGWCGPQRKARGHGPVYFVSGGRKAKLLPPSKDYLRGLPRLLSILPVQFFNDFIEARPE